MGNPIHIYQHVWGNASEYIGLKIYNVTTTSKHNYSIVNELVCVI